MRLYLYFGWVLVCFSSFLLSCGYETVVPKRFENQALYFKRDFRVKVIPVAPFAPGPGYVVRLYLSPEDERARKYDFIARTDRNGVVVFKDIRMGSVVAHCEVPGSQPYCGIEIFQNIGSDTTWTDELILTPCRL